MARDNTYDLYKKNKSARLKRFRHVVEFVLIRALMKFVGFWSIEINQKFGTLLGLLGYRLAKKDRGIAQYQLDFCLPELSSEQKDQIIKETFINLGKTFFEALVVDKFRKKREIWIQLKNPEIVSEASKEGKGTLLVFGHLANWELLGVVCEMLDIRGILVSAAVGEERLDDILMENRKSDNIRIIHRDDKKLFVTLMKCFRNNEVFLLAFDQDMRVPSVFVDFFGKKASTSKNIAVLAQKYGAPVVAAFGTRLDDGTHRFDFERLSRGPYRNGEEEIVELTQTYSLALEKHIRKSPSQWTWNHRRWKTQPDVESEIVQKKGWDKSKGICSDKS